MAPIINANIILPSCEACRLRKVKCNREQIEDECLSCRKKGIRCHTSAFAKPRKSRTGKRIESARQKYGTIDDMLSISQYSPDNSLVTIETGGLVQADFMERFFHLPHAHVPILDWDKVRIEFESCGRRIEQLPTPELKALAKLSIAIGARASNHPALLGPNPPTMEQVTAVNPDMDLISWGLRREQICQKLLEETIEYTDRCGIFRIASPESVYCLMLLEDLIDHADRSAKNGRPYATSAAGHIKELVREDVDENVCEELRAQGGAPGLLTLLRDIHSSAATGRPLNFNKEDMALIWHEREFYKVDPRTLPESLNTSRGQRWDNLLGFMAYLYQIGLFILENVTGKKTSTIKEASILQSWSMHDHLYDMIERFSILVNQAPDSAKNKTLYQLFLVTYYCSALFYENVIDNALKTITLDVTDASRYQVIKTYSVMRVINNAQKLCEIYLSQTLLFSGAISTLPLYRSCSLFAELPYYINTVLETPTAEFNGLFEYTMPVKLDIVKNLLIVSQRVGWAFGDMYQYIQRLQSFLSENSHYGTNESSPSSGLGSNRPLDLTFHKMLLYSNNKQDFLSTNPFGPQLPNVLAPNPFPINGNKHEYVSTAPFSVLHELTPDENELLSTPSDNLPLNNIDTHPNLDDLNTLLYSNVDFSKFDSL